MAVHVNGQLTGWLWLNFVTEQSSSRTIDTNTRSLWTSCLIRRLSSQISLIATACPHTDALRTGWSAPGSLRGNPSHGPHNGIGQVLFFQGHGCICECIRPTTMQTIMTHIVRLGSWPQGARQAESW